MSRAPTSPTPISHLEALPQPAASSSRPTSARPSADADDTTLAHERRSMEKASRSQRQRPSSEGASKASEAHGVDHAPLEGPPPVGDPDAMFEREKEGLEAAPPPGPGADADFPDGGLRAWLVVVGGVMCTASTFGFVNAWGAFQGYYHLNQLSHKSVSDIAWIGSLQYALTFMPSLFIGRLFDLGYFRVPMAVASAILVAATFLIAECTEYWHFLLCQGIAIGLCAGIIFGPTISVVSHWFKRRRGMALGIVAVGSSFGGTVFPIAFNRLLPQVGFAWTMRILGFILLVCLAIPNLALRRRLPPVNVKGGLINLRPFGEPALFLWTLAGFFCFLGLYTLLTFIEASAVFVGIPDSKAFYLVSIANAASAVGRIGSGFAADRWGAVGVTIPMTALAGVLTFVWPLVRSYGGFVGLAAVYGTGSGTFVALIVSPTIALGGIDDVGRRVGTYMTILAFGALAGPPISGAIEAATGSFRAVGYYAGSMVMVSVVVMIFVRRVVLGGWKGKF